MGTATQNRDDRWMDSLAHLGRLIIDRYFTKEEFIALSERYPNMRIERENNGKVTLMSPVKLGSGKRESIVIIYLGAWWLREKKGKTFNSQTGIELPDGSIKMPDCAWVSEERYAKITAEEEENEFLQVVPDFVVEVRSRSDSLKKLQAKMTTVWMRNGVRLGWLIDPYKEKVYIYREGQKSAEILQGFHERTLNGETIMPGMELPLDELKIRKK